MLKTEPCSNQLHVFFEYTCKKNMSTDKPRRESAKIKDVVRNTVGQTVFGDGTGSKHACPTSMKTESGSPEPR